MTETMTAAEMMARLAADPVYQAKRAEKTARLKAMSARLNEEAAPLLKDLEAAGFRVASVWDLVNTSNPYPAAIPILLAHLPRPYADRTRDGIARALAVPAAAHAWPTLLAQYRAAKNDSEVKSGLAAALAATATNNNIEELIGVVRDSSNGSSRVLLLSRLRNSSSKAATRALAELRNDPDLRKEIASWSNPADE